MCFDLKNINLFKQNISNLSIFYYFKLFTASLYIPLPLRNKFFKVYICIIYINYMKIYTRPQVLLSIQLFHI